MSGPGLDRSTVESLLELTRGMERAAAAADWDLVRARDAERRELLERVPSSGDAHALDVPSALVDALREADRALLSRARASRVSLGERTSRTRVERDVRRTYTDVMRSAGSTGAGT